MLHHARWLAGCSAQAFGGAGNSAEEVLCMSVPNHIRIHRPQENGTLLKCREFIAPQTVPTSKIDT